MHDGGREDAGDGLIRVAAACLARTGQAPDAPNSTLFPCTTTPSLPPGHLAPAYDVRTVAASLGNAGRLPVRCLP